MRLFYAPVAQLHVSCVSVGDKFFHLHFHEFFYISNMKETILAILMGIVTICSYIGYVPQLVKLIKTKNSEGLSSVSWIIFIVSLFCCVAYAIILGRWEMLVAYGSELGLSLIILYLIYRYRK